MLSKRKKHSTMKRQWIPAIIISISILLFYFLILPVLNITQFLESLKSTDLFLFILALFVILVSNAFAALRWSVLMQYAGAKKSQILLNAFGIFSLGQATGLIVPTRVGSYSKAPLIMTLDNLSYETALSAVNAETIVDLAYICCAGIASLIIISFFLSTHFFISTALIVSIIIFLIIALIVLYKIQYFNGIYEHVIAKSAENNRHLLFLIPESVMGKLFDLILSTREIFSQEIIIAKAQFLYISHPVVWSYRIPACYRICS